MGNINVWRLQIKNDFDEDLKKSVADYCLKNNVISLGWSLNDSDLEETSDDILKERQLISTGTEDEIFEKYESFVINHNVYKEINQIKRLKNEIKPKDLIWMRSNGIYYLGLVGENSKYIYDSSDEALNLDVSNQRSDIKWHIVGDESEVAGAVTTAFTGGRSLQKINQDGVLEFSEYLINKLHKKIYDIENIEKTPEAFFNLISSNDLEDLVSMWLYKKFGYVIVPSTIKSSTPFYEGVLINPSKKKKKKAIIKIQKVPIDLRYSDYKNLNCEVFLFSTEGKYIGEKLPNIHKISVKRIYKFAMKKKNDNFLPNKIIKWRELFKKYGK